MTKAGMRYCEEVTKKASKEGWKLNVSPLGYAWQKDGEIKYTAQMLFPNGWEAIHEACTKLDDEMKWKIHEGLVVEEIPLKE